MPEKFVFACRAYPTTRVGGMPFVCQDRAEALARLKLGEVHVLTAGNRPSEVLNNVNVHYVGGPEVGYSREYAEGCLSFCRKINPDVVHLDSCDQSHRWWLDLSKKAFLTLHGFGAGAELTLFNRGAGNPDFIKQLPEAKVFRTFQKVFAVSEHELWMLEDIYSLPNAKLLRNPIAEYFFHARSDSVVVDVPTLLSSEVAETSTRNFNATRFVAEKLGWDSKVIRGVSRVDMPWHYDSSSVLFLPTDYSQGFDLTVLEAMARGKHVVAACTGSYSRAKYVYPMLHTYPRNDLDEVVRVLTDVIRFTSVGVLSNGPLHESTPFRHVQNWLHLVGV